MGKVVHYRSIAALNLPKPVPALIQLAKGIVQTMTGNPLFPAPNPTLAVVNAALADLEDAQVVVMTRLRGAAAARNVKREALARLLFQLKAYVQKLADAAGEGEAAAVSIEAAGMSVKRRGAYPSRVFAAKQGTVSGSVKMIAPVASDRASYKWEYSTDGDASWTTAATTWQSTAGMRGLRPGGWYLFRYRVVTKAGVSDWSEPTGHIVT